MSQVIEYFTRLFSTEGLPPRWLCGVWPPFQGWFYIFSDLAIAAAYFAIPLLLTGFIRRRNDLPFPKIFWLFAAFILWCGCTHLMDAVMFWWPAYRLTGLVFFITAVVSWTTIVALIPIIPKALLLKSPLVLEREIEERKKVETELRFSEMRFRLLVSGVADYAIFFMTPEGHISTWNQAAERLNGYTEEDIVGKHFSIFYPPEALEKNIPNTELEMAKQTGNCVDEGYRLRKDGSRFWASVIITALRDEQGELIGFSNVTRDLTERKLAEDKLHQMNIDLEKLVEQRTQALKQANERYELVVRGSNDGIWDWNIEKNELFWSDRLYQILGMDRPAVEPTLEDFMALVHPGDKERVRELLNAHFQDPHVAYEQEFRMRHSSGDYRHCKSRGEVQRDETGKPVRMAGMLTDFTERKLAEDALRQSLEREQLAIMIINSIRSEIDLNTILIKTINILGRFSQADRCALWLYQPETQKFLTPEFEYHSIHDSHLRFIKDTQYAHLPIISESTEDKEVGNFADIDAVPDLSEEERLAVAERCIKSLLSVPVIYKDQLLGRLQIHSVFEHREWTPEMVKMVQHVSAQVAVAIYNAQTLQNLKEMEARKSAIMESALDAVIIVGHDSKIQEWNAGAERMFKISRQDAIGADLASLIIPERFRTAHYQGLFHYLETGQGPVLDHLIEMPALRANGEEFYAELSITRIPLNGPPLFAGTLRDITERKQNEQDLKESEERFRLIADSSPVMIWMITAEPKITYYNKAALEFIGATSTEEEQCQNWQASIFPDDLTLMENTMNTALRNRDKFTVEYRCRRADGEYRWLLTTGLPRLTPQQELLGFIGSSVDITEHKQITQILEQRVNERTAQLQATNKELEAFSYSVSHDLRAPLRTIDGFSQAVMEMYGDTLDDRGKDYLRRVRQGSQQMAQLIDDMLKLSRLTRGELTMDNDVNLSQMATEIAALLKNHDPDRQVTFTIEPDLKATGDKRLLYAVLQNLMDNAWKYSSKHTQAHIEFGRIQSQDASIYYVKDDGAGFNMSYADKLFGAFQRLHGVHEFPGTGVGLATVARIIHRHGGEIWAESEIEQGATFYFTLQPIQLQEKEHAKSLQPSHIIG